MKKILILCLFLMLISTIAFASPSFELVDNHGKNIDNRGWNTYEINGTYPGTTVVSTSNIPVGSKILGYTVAPIPNTSNDMRVELYDDDSSAYARNLCINESEQPITDYRPVWFSFYPRILQYGLVVNHYGGVKILIHWTP